MSDDSENHENRFIIKEETEVYIFGTRRWSRIGTTNYYAGDLQRSSVIVFWTMAANERALFTIHAEINWRLSWRHYITN